MPSADKVANRERLRKWRLENPEKYRIQLDRAEAKRVRYPPTAVQRTKKAATQAALRAKKRELVNAAKSGPCADCGNSFPPYVMDLHHVNGDGHKTKYRISGLRLSLPALKDEIEKCVALCANCHRIRHHSD